MIRRFLLRLSIARGIHRQKIARQIRSADVKRGLAKSRGEAR